MKLFGVDISPISKEEFFDIVKKVLEKNEQYLIGHINIRGANFAYEEEKFRSFYEKCDIVTCDGVGILLGLKLFGVNISLTRRITAPDYLDELLFFLERSGYSIYFLSSTEEVISKTERIVFEKFPELNFKVHHGFFEKTGKGNEKVLEEISAFNPDILYVGFGMPIQEYWIMDNFEKISAKVILPLGACLDFYTGKTYRGPRILTDYGFEWLTRLFTEPRKLWRRYVVGNPKFFMRVIKERLKT